jgi:pimeloyl-ACP methyl ester carboxylesterase
VVKGAIYFGPMSDYASAKKDVSVKNLARTTAHARKMIKAKCEHELLPAKLWPEILDAQRFVSLYTPDSLEEIFSYASPAQKPVILQKTNKPLLIVLAENDEFRDRPMAEIAEWFKRVLRGRLAQVKTVKGANHFFAEQTGLVKRIILDWLKEI